MESNGGQHNEGSMNRRPLRQQLRPALKALLFSALLFVLSEGVLRVIYAGGYESDILVTIHSIIDSPGLVLVFLVGVAPHSQDETAVHFVNSVLCFVVVFGILRLRVWMKSQHVWDHRLSERK